MAEFSNRIQNLMYEMYSKWQRGDDKNKWEVLGDFSAAHQIAVVFGNFNYQVENGGIEQWIYNGYFHDDSEKFIEYLEIGAEIDARCRNILDRVYQLDQYAQETDCDLYGKFYDADNDGDSSFIGDIINGDAFNKWYYENCGDEDWWKSVCSIIDKVKMQLAPVGQYENDADNTTKPPIQVYIGNVHDDRIGGFTMPLPTTMEALQPFLDGAEISGWQDLEILEVMSDIDGLGEMLSAVAKRTMSQDALDELNHLSAKIADLDVREYDIFSAAVGQKRHCGSVEEIINITENLGNFDLQPAFDAASLGEFLVDAEGDRHSNGFEKLYASTDEELRGLADYIEYLEKHTDYTAYGIEYAENEKGVFTKHGYFTEFGDFKTEYCGSHGIPDAHRLFTKPGEICKQPLKFDDVDIAAAIMKLYAVSGYHISTAPDAFKVLSEAQGRDYVLLLNPERISLLPATDVYKRGELAGKIVEHWSDQPSTQFFAIRVMERGDSDQDRVKGDIIELNTAALRSNIARHGITPDRIDAVRHDGFSKSYDLPTWAEVPEIQRSGLAAIIPNYPDGSQKSTAVHYGSFMGAHEKYSAVMELDAFLPEVNAPFMAAAQYPQSDMLRIANEAAKEILARGDADIFKLTADGTEKLEVIESMRPLCFAEHRDLAIKREDIAGLDKWSERHANKLMRQNERGDRSALKNKGEEL